MLISPLRSLSPIGGSSSSSWTPQTLVVENAEPTKVVMTSTKADTSLVASDFTIVGFTVSSLSRDATNKILTLTLSTSVVYGNVLNVVLKGTSYPVTNNVAGVGFITEWTVSGDATARTITLPLVNTRTEGALAYNCTVDWGDGSDPSTITTYNDADRAHTYASNGTYQVNIIGTCEGWSFNNGGDKLKITKIINWGTSGVFNGFKYLLGGFYGCTNLTSLGTGKILASGTGVLTQGFYRTFRDCKFASIQTGLFDNHTALTTTAFSETFYNCINLTTIPADLFKYNTLITTDAFLACFFGCTVLNNIPTDTFRYNTLVSTRGFMQTFRSCTSLTTLPVDIWRYNTLVSSYAFYDCFQNDTAFVTIPQDIFRYNVNCSGNAFEGTFIGTSITTVPTDLFRYNTLVTTQGFAECFNHCTQLLTVCPNLFKYNLLCGGGTGGFSLTFNDCPKLQLRDDMFYAAGEQATRFLLCDAGFPSTFVRATFTGTQGVAPDLWNCTYPIKLEVNVRPSALWVAGDIITGQTSGTTAVVTGWLSTWVVLVKDVSGVFTSDEIIGVTGVPTKLANQGAGYPTLTPTIDNPLCFNGAGNSVTSISNYADIPVGWL